MVVQKFGNADRDMSSRVGKKAKTKEISDKPMKGPGTDIAMSAKIGGLSNKTTNKSDKKGAA
jgi:hypothetical protein